jgi:hypothetical protein
MDMVEAGQGQPSLPFFKLRSSCGLGSGIVGLIAILERISRPHPSGTPRAGSTSFSGGDAGGTTTPDVAGFVRTSCELILMAGVVPRAESDEGERDGAGRLSESGVASGGGDSLSALLAASCRVL